MEKNQNLKPLFGVCISYPAPGIIERIGESWDWIWLDGQHGQIAGYDAVLSMVRACDFIERPAFLRVPGHDAGCIGLALDMGVAAVIVPQIDNVEQAKAMVRLAKFPPLGNRSFGGRRPIDLHGRSYSENANSEVKLICQIESPEAVSNAEEIASVPGVDGLFLGPDDLMLRMGHSMNLPSNWDVLVGAVNAVASACGKSGKSCICIGVDAHMLTLYRSLGVTHVVAGSDVGFLAAGTKSALAEIEKSEHFETREPFSHDALNRIY